MNEQSNVHVGRCRHRPN